MWVQSFQKGSFDELLERFKKECVVWKHPGSRFGWRVAPSAAALFLDAEEFRKCVETFNLHQYRQLDDDKNAVLLNLGHRLRYLLSTGSGILFEPYFALVDAEKQIYCACNGWTVSGKSDDSVYLRRELVVWSDLAKLRFGDKPSDNPELWSLMEKYTEQSAALFDGFRIDNAHTTPRHVAKHLLQRARLVRPDLYVVAELFTGSNEQNLGYASEVGVHSIVLEAMRAWDIGELTRLMYQSGGSPVGCVESGFPFRSVPALTAVPVMFLDCSHDNRPPAEVRHIADTLSNAACVWSSCCAVGSTWGVDELVPSKISVESEKRLYPRLPGGGITAAKAKLGELHLLLGNEGFSEVHVDCRPRGLVVVQRHNPLTHESVFFLCRSAFDGNSVLATVDESFGTVLTIQDASSVEIACGFSLVERQEDVSRFVSDPSFINGLSGLELSKDVSKLCLVEQSAALEWRVSLRSFPLGSVVCLRSFPHRPAVAAAEELRNTLIPNVAKAVSRLSLLDLNVILYRCAAEERVSTDTGSYNVPGWKSASYCGLMGVHQWMLEEGGNLASPLYDHLRHGNWLMSYCWERLERHREISPAAQDLALWLKRADQLCSQQPRNLIPKYFTMAISAAGFPQKEKKSFASFFHVEQCLRV